MIKTAKAQGHNKVSTILPQTHIMITNYNFFDRVKEEFTTDTYVA